MAADFEPACLRSAPATDLIGAAQGFVASGDASLAATVYREWVSTNTADPLRYAVYFNLGVVLSALNDCLGARDAFLEAIRLNPDFAPAYVNIGMVLERLEDRVGAIGKWQALINRLAAVNAESITYKISALKQISRVFTSANLDSNAEQTLHQSLEIAPHQRDILQHWLSLRQRQCEWPVVQPVPGLTRAQVVAGFSPLSLAAYTDDPLFQLAVAADYSRNEVGRPTRSFASVLRGRSRSSSALRVGYLSSDLREHAIGHLMVEIFELHDREKVEVSAYYCGHQVNDALHGRIKAAADRWIDIRELTDGAAAERIVDDEIDILVDINGYTHGARTAVLAMRPAPVIVNWLGFPNTTGSPYHDYIIADDVIIPQGNEIFYSETVKRLPCYQPNDRRRTVADRTGSRAEAGLPETGTVFCCFNAAHKLTSFTWQRWMRILSAVPDSVLWLLDGVPSTNARLLAQAANSGIAPERIVFAPKLGNALHLARYPLADLFLDTSPYGAHTTGSDALWMGVPVLTIAGRSFASRVCASLVSAAGLPDLVCPDGESYVARAIELATERRKLDDLRRRLRDGRDDCVLFDTPKLVSRLETLYAEMAEETYEGRTPRPDLSNLEHYRSVGAALDRDDVELSTIPGYRERYRAALADLDEFEMIRPDTRLWNGQSP